MAGQHGGARPGAGRKRNVEKYATQAASFTDMCAEHLRPAFWRLFDLIQGGERVEIKMVPASTLSRKGLARDDDGVIVRDDKGKPSLVDIPLYPKLGDELVLAERKTTTLQPEIRAIQELLARVMGVAFRSEDEAFDPEHDAALGPADFAILDPEDLDALEKIAGRLASVGPAIGPRGGPGGEGEPR